MTQIVDDGHVADVPAAIAAGAVVEYPEVSHYDYRVAWSAEDEEFVATCVEFPSLSWLDEHQIAALQGLQAIIAGIIADLKASGEEVPQPLAERTYSGKLNLRLGTDLHRRVAMEAAEAGLSINTFLVRKACGLQ